MGVRSTKLSLLSFFISHTFVQQDMTDEIL